MIYDKYTKLKFVLDKLCAKTYNEFKTAINCVGGLDKRFSEKAEFIDNYQ